MRELITAVDIFTDDSVFLLVIWSEDSRVYLAKDPSCRMDQVDTELINGLTGDLVPNNHIYPPWKDGIKAAPTPLLPNLYLKTCQKVWGYDGTSLIADCVAKEVRIMELISSKPHPNICCYYGCVREGGLIRGIVLQKYRCTLLDAISHNKDIQIPPFNIEKVINGIQDGLNHIHSFGLAHNDVNPTNIMLDDVGNAVIIDFDSCALIGTPVYGGTPGWTNWPTVAAIDNDTYGFELIVKFLRGEYDGRFDDNDMPIV
ncbi:hypothetical protein NLJ89_g7077 [Agrocybe chaxingu]|uniref:Protein kinase domain-containing protein n=1 Tax=Agrocybe chaxingu TaxID=84603 RepID=A0A9W8JXH6_9AGAR|nr:hypothetical protein NLJ89_g7077 [Agrocybe chaxingu]